MFFSYPFHNFLNGSFVILFLGDFMCSYRAFDEYEGIEVAWNQVNVPHDVVFNDHDDCDYFSKFLNQFYDCHYVCLGERHEN